MDADASEYFDESVEELLEMEAEENTTESANKKNSETRFLAFTKWTPWSVCTDCIQMRSRRCVREESCNDSTQFEERTCKSKRCKRRKRRRKNSDVVVQLKDLVSGPSRRGKKLRIWSKWSDWTECSFECRTSRKRTCRKPGRCRKKIQTQNAYCYRESSYCESYVLNLIESSHKIAKPAALDRKVSISNYNKYSLQRNPTRKPLKQYKCGLAYKKGNMLKIIGGSESRRNKWPWHVAVINIFGEVFCAGTLIYPQWVLTAAHCLRSVLYVRLNEHDLQYLEGAELELRVKQMVRHPLFNRETVDNDIALLKLPKAVNVPVACLPSALPRPGEMCNIVGWGKRQVDDLHGTTKLQEAQLPVVSSNACSRAYRSYLITKNMFCAGYSSGQADTCAGDSGGGLMCPPRKGHRGYSVQGITSFGDGCGRQNKYGIYTAVHNYVQWINNVINDI